MKNRFITTLRRLRTVTVATFIASTTMIACLTGCDETTHRNLLGAYESEAEAIPAVVLYDCVFTQSGQTDVNAVLKESGINSRIRRFLCIYNDRVYFTYMSAKDQSSNEADSSRMWNIASVALNGDELNVHHTAHLDPVLEYGIETGAYEEKSAFFKNGVVVLNDKYTVIEYDITSNSVTEFEYENYVFPTDDIEYEITDYHTVSFAVKSGEETVHKSLTLEQLTSSAGVVGEICKSTSQKKLSGESCFEHFFSFVQRIDEKTYIICEVMNNLGETYAIVLEYDFTQNSCLYVDSHFIGDRPYGDFYLIDTYAK